MAGLTQLTTAMANKSKGCDVTEYANARCKMRRSFKEIAPFNLDAIAPCPIGKIFAAKTYGFGMNHS